MTMVAEKVGAISVHKMHPHIGAEVRGVDLSQPLDGETLRQIKDAWHQHAVLVFRDQKLSEDDQRRFASNFGPVAKRVPPPAGAPKMETVAWDDMMMITDHVDENGKAVGSLGHGDGPGDDGRSEAIDIIGSRWRWRGAGRCSGRCLRGD